MLGADDLIRLLGLKPLPGEGGYFAETYRSAYVVPSPARTGSRSAATAIFYLLTPESHSALHRLQGDEVYHFYLGDPVRMLNLHPGGSGEELLLGPDLASGHRLQHVVPGGVWQGSRLQPGGRYALMGTTMAPGFDPRDYEPASRDALLASHSAHAGLIRALAD